MTDLSSALNACLDNGKKVLELIKEKNFAPTAQKTFNRRFNITQAASMVGVTSEAIRQAEKADKISPPSYISPSTNRRAYSLNEINLLRDHFKTRPGRRKNDQCTVVGVINFKGGVYKSTTSLHFAQYMALKGYRVLVVDADSQATTTQLCGFTPDEDIEPDETLAPFLVGEISSLKPCIRKTSWDGMDLIPANLYLYDVELSMPGAAKSGDLPNNFYDMLNVGLETVKQDYDLIIIDAPPSLGVISMNVVYSADGIVVPLPPHFADFCSTLQFFNMLIEITDRIGHREFSFIKLLITKFDGSDEAKAFVDVIRHVFGSDLVLNNLFRNTAEIPRASQDLMTVYELTDIKVKETYKRAVSILDRINAELEVLVQRTWPSYAEELVEEGVF